jgi:sugar lactone lactonase YvrE
VDKGLFRIAYENPDVSIYRVVGGDTEDVVVPRREALPAPSPETVAAAQPTPSEPEELPSIAEKAPEGAIPWPRLREPRGAAVDDRQRVWIADFGHSRLRVYDANGGFLGGWGGRGAGQHGFNELCAVAVRGHDLYVADTWNGRVQAFDLDGTWKASATELYGPRGVAVGPDGRVWVSDTGNGRVMRYESNLTGGAVIGKKGQGKTEFDGPIGIAVGPSGRIYVADTGNRRIQVLEPDGAFATSWPVIAWVSGSEPQVAVGGDEKVYVSDPPGGAVLELSPDGRPLRRMIVDSAGKPFSAPTGLALDRKNRILYVINSGNSSVSTIELFVRTKK